MTDWAVPWVLSTIRVTGVSLAAITGKARVRVGRHPAQPEHARSWSPRSRRAPGRARAGGAMVCRVRHQVAAVVEDQVGAGSDRVGTGA